MDFKIPPITKEYLRECRIKTYLDLRKDKSSLAYWHPKIEQYNSIQSLLANMIPQPETHIVRLSYEEILDESKKHSRFYDLNMQRIKEACAKVGYPCFIKTDKFSGKHDWADTCFVKSEKDIEKHIYAVTAMASMCGCEPALDMVVRKLIPTVPLFYAFKGNLPIVTERRYFVENGKVIFHHPYWIPSSIQKPSIPNWLKILNEDNIEPIDEITYLCGLTEKIGVLLGESWSVDWLNDKDGNWWLTDMAEAEKSFMWDDYGLGKIGLK